MKTNKKFEAIITKPTNWDGLKVPLLEVLEDALVLVAGVLELEPVVVTVGIR